MAFEELTDEEIDQAIKAHVGAKQQTAEGYLMDLMSMAPAMMGMPVLAGKPSLPFKRWRKGREGSITGFRGGKSKRPMPKGMEDLHGTEGVGQYIAKEKELAGFFGKSKRVTFKEPKSVLRVKDEPLHILHETDEILKPIKATDSEWTKLNKQAVINTKTTHQNWGEKGSGELQRELTRLMLDKGYDAVSIKSGLDEWAVILNQKLRRP